MLKTTGTRTEAAEVPRRRRARMVVLFLLAAAPSCAPPPGSGDARDRHKDVKVVCDQKYDPDDNLALEFGAKFSTREAMLKYLDLARPITGADGKTRRLVDILVEMELNGNGDVARWLVSGPAATVRVYKATMDAAAKDARIIYDYSVEPANCKPTAYFEGDEP